MAIFEQRKPTLFELALLAIGAAVLVGGFYIINKMYLLDGRPTWNLIIAALLWLMLIFHIIIPCSTQDIKEELAILIKQTNEQIRLLRKDLNKKRRK
jgi:hypothetical protein